MKKDEGWAVLTKWRKGKTTYVEKKKCLTGDRPRRRNWKLNYGLSTKYAKSRSNKRRRKVANNIEHIAPVEKDKTGVSSQKLLGSISDQCACGKCKISAHMQPSNVWLTTTQAQHTQRNNAICGDMRDLDKWPMEPSMTNAWPLELTNRQIKTPNNSSVQNNATRWIKPAKQINSVCNFTFFGIAQINWFRVRATHQHTENHHISSFAACKLTNQAARWLDGSRLT